MVYAIAALVVVFIVFCLWPVDKKPLGNYDKLDKVVLQEKPLWDTNKEEDKDQ